MSKKLLHLTPAKRSQPTQTQHIPNNIFQTWETHIVSKEMHQAVSTWIDKNPGWNHYVFDKNERRCFIEKHFDKEVLWAYDQLIPGAYQADLWRYCVLFIQGGVYADIKMSLLVNSLEEIIEPEDNCIVVKDKIEKKSRSRHNINQAFIVSSPRHDLLSLCIKKVVNNVKTGYYGPTCLSVSGPELFGRCVNTLLKQPLLHQQQPGIYPSSHGKIKILPILNTRTNKIINLNKKDIIEFSYKKYYQEERLEHTLELVSRKNIERLPYHTLWAINQVYWHGKVMKPKSAIYYTKQCYRRTMRRLYQINETKKARTIFKVASQKHHRSIKLFIYYIAYETRILIKSFFKKEIKRD